MKNEIESALDRGWQLIPLNGKIPTVKGWQLGAADDDARIRNALTARQHHDAGGNCGLVCGKPSGVVVVDIDTHSGAIMTEDDFPTTWTVITGKGGKHLIFKRPDVDFIGNSTKGLFQLATDGKSHIDIRGDGGQVVMVGSIHPETGAHYSWMTGRSPSDIPCADFPAEILARIAALAKPIAPAQVGQYKPWDSSRGTHPWVAAMLKNMSAKLAQSKGGNNNLLNETSLILGHYCPQYLAHDEIEAALIEAMWGNGYLSHCGMYAVRATIASGISAGMRESKHPPENKNKAAPVATKVITKPVWKESVTLKSGEPRSLASHFLETCDSRSLAFWMDSFWEYSQGAYQQVKDSSVDVKIRNGLEGVMVPKWNAKEEVFEDVKLVLKNSVVSEVFGAVKALDGVYLNGNVEAPMWRDGRNQNPREIFTARNGLFNLRTGEFSPHDSTFFNLGASDFDFEQVAQCPEWDKFLQQVFIKDPTQIRLLQEWFGYCLTYDCSQRKVMLLLGITTSGKGTIMNVLSSLMGRKNMMACEPADTLDKFFGASVFGKRLLNFFDLRMGGRLDAAAFGAFILKMAEGAPRTIEAKNKDAFTSPTVAKVTIASNNLPRFVDSSSAVAGRFLTLKFTESFLGREDKDLDNRLLSELPGIFHWALSGLERLQDSGWRWTEHAAGIDTRESMANECSPVKRFVDEECVLDANSEIDKINLFHFWKKYCGERNIQAVGNDSIFSSQLHDAFPVLEHGRPKEHGTRKCLPRTHIGIRIKFDHEK